MGSTIADSIKEVAPAMLSFEMRYATYTVAWALILTIIEIAATMAFNPLWGMGNRTAGEEPAGLCRRIRNAADNNRINCVMFVLTLLIADNAGVHSNAMHLACRLFLGCRIFHAIFYAIGLAPMRTVAFLGSYFAFVIVITQIVGMKNVTVEQYIDQLQSEFNKNVYPHIEQHVKHLDL
ncbi:hypothetical protein SARC_05478 [Sphaeroforma arctica JP610]|uniref:MAPEG family protein n=1 Tax=Sphaeroforma arctica JP610 TaxID=667725 RepID=A0A0L0G076_9EUKA|nr:hypothetical protein SARC_05478 [Sphaeroforma arctica JP610]KNC82236.1 hypothetical protein SARC_05478 [Sphaeroforma arctica JP610]|eukprot:XP_014156138.1 hypothetical protein SARC_05478 [Sphaeroforma arctica JP610]